jgi:hypothetical protein
MAREYFRLNQHMLEREGTMVTRVFILSDADLERTNVIVPILQQHQSTGIGWAIVIFDELNPTISNHQNKPLDFALLTGTEDQQKAGNEERIKAISYFRDYRETSRRYTVVFWTDDNNRKEIESQRDLYHSLFAHCWLASSSFKEIFACQSLFHKDEKDQVCEDVKFATDRLIARLESLPDDIRPQITWPPPKEKDQLFLHEVSDVDEIRATICWLRDVRTAHRNWQDGETNTDCDT